MTLGVAAWLIVLAALLVLFAVVLRRMSVLVARTRDLERFQHATRSLDARLAGTVEPLVVRLDEIRRRAGDPQALAAQLEPAQATLRGLAEEAHRMRPPAALAGLGAALIEEIERAGRAADMVEHGLDALVAGRSGRELEAQTSLKRGALNLRHAREASAGLTARITTIRPADLVERGGRWGHAAAGSGPGSMRSLPTYLVDGYEPDDVGQHPRM
jgi:hypothetical protein